MRKFSLPRSWTFPPYFLILDEYLTTKVIHPQVVMHDGNIPAKPTYGVYISQLVRIGRICDSFKAFNARHTELTHRLMKQGFKYDKLCRKFKEFARKHNHLIKKFHVSIHKHIKQGISVPLKLSKKLARNVTVRRN